jgi:hypothetical protein
MLMSVNYNGEEKNYYFQCPHCEMFCQVPKDMINCKIFRHAINSKTLKFMNPHAPKDVCEQWVLNGEIYGCGKPFFFDGNIVRKCDYL